MAMKTGARQSKDNGNAKARGKDWTRLPILNLPLCAHRIHRRYVVTRASKGNTRVVVYFFWHKSPSSVAYTARAQDLRVVDEVI